MAFVVARPNGRFEIRESEHTPRGPRARTLAGFRVLSDAVLDAAARRASRPFDVQAVLRSSQKAGAPVEQAARASQDAKAAHRAFVEASRRMARIIARPSDEGTRRDPGVALIELLGFADEVRRGQPARPAAPLAFPALAQLARKRDLVVDDRGGTPMKSGG